ncbi:MAG: tetratricopeptide repeat protein [Opitutaceae bacterium]|jgi:tetratricopeptide (TPR) repeat protein
MNGSAPDALSARKRTLAGMALIFLATFAAYAPVFHAGFIWNDPDYVTAPALRSLSGLWRVWFQVGATQQYYPILHSAFWVEHRIWGDAPLGYHLLNVGLHATSAVLLVILLRRLAIPGAWLAALVFALHPVCVESAAWISEQKNTLSTVFYLASAISYLRFSDARSPGRYALASLFFILAVLSKTVTASLPAALLVLAWWRNGSVSWRRDVAPLVPWLVFGAIAGLFSGWVERHYVGAEGAAFDLTGLERLLLAGRAVWFYAAKVVWPANLIFFYPRWTISSGSPAAYAYLLGVLAALAALSVLSRRSRAPLAGALFFGGTLFPTLGFFNVYGFVFSYVADHWQYLASLGLIVPICAGLARAARALALSARRAAAAALLALLGVLTWRQAGMYSDMETFYRTTIAKNPGAWMAYNNLGTYLLEHHLPGAREEFEAALKLRPDYKPAHFNLGVILLDSGRYEDAVAHLKMASGTLHQDYVHLYLGEALADLQRYPEAAAEYSLHTRLEPGNTAAWFGLGNALAAQEQYSAAAGAYRRALAIDPHLVDAHNNLGNVLLLTGQVPAAVAEYREALRLRPGDPALQKSLQLALEAQSNGR